MKIGFDAKRYYHNHTGLGNYSRTLVAGIGRLHPEHDLALYDAGAFERTFRLGRRAASEGCDVFHGLSNELPRDVVGRVPCVVTMHDVAWRSFPAMYTAVDRAIYDWKYGYAARHADIVICISDATRREVQRYYHVPDERLRVVYQPVDALYYEAPPTVRGTDEPYLLSVGSVNERKNLLATVKALALLPAAARPRLVVVGQGHAYRRRVECAIAELGLTGAVSFVTDVHDAAALRELYAGAAAMVYPSFCEGFGLPVVEASLTECPVVTSNVSSLPEAAAGTALLVDPTQPAQIADAIAELLADPAAAKQRGQEARKQALARFCPDMLFEQVNDIYKELLTDRQ